MSFLERSTTDYHLAMLIAFGATVTSAAQQAGISLSTANRRLSDPKFQQRLAEIRTSNIEALHGRINQIAKRIPNMPDMLILGIEKTGAFVDHLDQLDTNADGWTHAPGGDPDDMATNDTVAGIDLGFLVDLNIFGLRLRDF